MSVTIDRLMAQGVVMAQPDDTAGHVQRQMETLDIHALPVADASGVPIGIVRSRDLLGVDSDAVVRDIMSREVVTVERYVDVRTAASLMRQRRQRQLLVVDKGVIVGIVSAFDFLELLEGYRFEASDEAPEFRTGIFYPPKLEEPGS